MNTIYMFVPIVFLLIIFSLIFFLTKLVAHKKNRYLPGNRIKWILLTYITILVVAFAINFFIPSDANSSKMKEIRNIEFGFLHNHITNGNVDKVDRFLSEDWSFPYNGEELQIATVNNSLDGVSIMIDRRKDQVKSVDVSFYQLPSYVEGIEITEEIPVPRMELTNGMLTMRNAPEQDLNFKTYKEAFTVSQFLSDNGEMDQFIGDSKIRINRIQRPSTLLQGQLIYIRVPKGVEVKEKGNLYVEYLWK